MATTNSKMPRLGRFLDNRSIRVRRWYAPVARRLLNEAASRNLTIRLIVDGTKVGFAHQLLC